MNKKVLNFLKICDFKGGTQPPKSTFSSTPKENYVRLLQIQDFSSDQYQIFVKKSDSLSYCEKNDILIGRYGASVGKVFRGKSGAHNVALIKAVIDDEIIDRDYFYYYLQSELFQSHLKKVSARAAQAGFSKSDFTDFKFSIPSTISLQRQVSARLKAQMAEIETARQAAQVQLFDVFKLEKAIYQEIENKIFSTSCEVRNFGSYVLSYRNGFGKRPKTGEVGPIVLRIADVSTGVISIQNPRYGEITKAEADSYRLHEGDLLFIRVNGAKHIVGRCCIVDSTLPENTIFNDHLIRVQLNKELDSAFARLCVSLPRARQLIEEVASTSAGQLTINQQLLNRLEIPVYSVEEQRNIVINMQSKINHLISFRKAFEQQLSEINLLPQKILTQAFEK